MLMRKTGLAIVMLPLSLLLASCNGMSSDSSTKKENASRIVLTFWDENAGPSRTPYYMELIRRFHKQYPEIEVQYTGIPLSLNKIKYDVAISSNDMPDVAGLSEAWISDYASKGVLLPLDDYFNAWPEKTQIASSFIDYNRTLAADHKLYQLPTTFNFDVVWYRSDWFREAGLEAPRTWDDFFKGAVALTDAKRQRFGYSLRGADGSVSQLTSLLYAYSGRTDYFTQDGKCTINAPEHVKFLKKYVALYQTQTAKSDIASGYKEMVAAFDSGEAAMIQHNFGSYSDHLQALGQGKFEAALLPPGINGRRAMSTVANGYGIFKSSRHPDAAWKLLSFLSSKESQLYWNSHVGQMPTNTQAWNTEDIRRMPFLQEAFQALNDERTVKVQVPYALPAYTSIVKQQLEPQFQEVLAGTMPPDAFLNGWAKLMEGAYAQYKQKYGSFQGSM